MNCSERFSLEEDACLWGGVVHILLELLPLHIISLGTGVRWRVTFFSFWALTGRSQKGATTVLWSNVDTWSFGEAGRRCNINMWRLFLGSVGRCTYEDTVCRPGVFAGEEDALGDGIWTSGVFLDQGESRAAVHMPSNTLRGWSLLLTTSPSDLD